LYSVTHAEYVYDNTLNPTLNIWNGLRYKIFFDWNRQVNKVKFADGPTMYNLGVDVRYYYPIFRNFIWAGRAAADFSWGNQKTIYYLGGTDGWLQFGGNQKSDGTYRYFNPNNTPAPDNDYAFQSLAVNMRGFTQNVANGNNAIVLNSEFRLPIFSTLISKPINNAFLRNLQAVQFIDLGNAWNGNYNTLKRPETVFGNPPVQIVKKVGGIGPLAGGYGFGVRSMLLGYFLRFDAAWTMDGIFKGKPKLYLSMGVDF
jgi:outer membrane protein assembly factor BamA